MEVKNVWKKYRESTDWVLKQVNLSLQKGDGVIIYGPNGSGKSTLIKIMAGLIPPTKGEVTVLNSHPLDKKVKNKLGVVLHEPMLYRELTVSENLSLFKKLYKITRTDEMLSNFIELLGIRRYWNARVNELSFGWRRRVDILRALVHNPSIFMIDEPTTGLDEASFSNLVRIINELNSMGKTIILSSPHTLPRELVEGKKVFYIREGRLVS